MNNCNHIKIYKPDASGPKYQYVYCHLINNIYNIYLEKERL